jgi:hypothetical protein
MVKKISVTVLSVAVFAIAGQAQASFGNDHLTQVFYTDNNNKVEIGVDLGGLGTDFNLTEQNKTLKTVNYAALAAGKGAAVGDLRMGLYIDSLIKSTDSVWDHYFVTTTSTTPAVPAAYPVYNWYRFMDSATEAITKYYTGGQVSKQDGGTVVMVAPDNAGSYRTRMTMSGFVKGTYRTTNVESASAPRGELNLAEMGGKFTDLYLWHFAYDVSPKTSHLLAGATTDYSAVLRFYSNGTTVLNPTAVPLPGAVWMLGSTLFGLLGLRRRMGVTGITKQ